MLLHPNPRSGRIGRSAAAALLAALCMAPAASAETYDHAPPEPQPPLRLASVSCDLNGFEVEGEPTSIDLKVRTNRYREDYFACGSPDPDADLTYTVVTPPTNGWLDSDYGWFWYEPKEDFAGADKYVFTVSDGTNTSPQYTVNLTVGATENNAPSCYDFEYPTGNVRAGSAVTLNPDCSDAEDDPLTYVITQQPPEAHGTVAVETVVEDYGDGDVYEYDVLKYTAKPGAPANAISAFEYKAVEKAPWTLESEPAGMQVFIRDPSYNTPPECYSYYEGYGYGGYEVEDPLLVETDETPGIYWYCSDDEEDPIAATATVTDAPQHGTLSQGPGEWGDPLITYTPTNPNADPGEAGTPDDFAFRVSDQPPAPATSLSSYEDKWFLKLTRPDHNPTCTDATGAVPSGQTTLTTVLTCTDGDIADALEVWFHDPEHGWLDEAADQSNLQRGQLRVIYDAPSGFTGTDTVEFGATDGVWEEDPDFPEDVWFMGDDVSEPATLTVTVGGSGTATPTPTPGGGTNTGGGGTNTGGGGTSTGDGDEGDNEEEIINAFEGWFASDGGPLDQATGSFGSGLKSTGGGVQTGNLGPYTVPLTFEGDLETGGRRIATIAKSVGTGVLNLPAGATGKLKLKLTKAARKILAKKGKLKATMTIGVTHVASGAYSETTKQVVIKGKKAKKKKK